MSNPYRNLPDHCFWSRAVTWAPTGGLDPVVKGVRISPSEKVATMGSCFAQHLARHIAKSGMHYFVTEQAPAGLDPAAARKHNYGVFSARYGNVYTVMQALQLFDRAFGKFTPKESVWPHQGGFVDAFRPQIDPQPHDSIEKVLAARAGHLAAVRKIFLECDWLVFTLGLTEAWRSKADGAIFPVAPGVAGGAFDPDRHEFVNFTAGAVSATLSYFIERLKSVNPGMKILLTVSPVPLIATYENRHVWVSTTISKAALRVAADEAERKFDHVTYFPSYEIITSPSAEGRYYHNDLREVREAGVNHVMRVFSKHFIGNKAGTGAQKAAAPLPAMAKKDEEIICDEELVESSIKFAENSVSASAE